MELADLRKSLPVDDAWAAFWPNIITRMSIGKEITPKLTLSVYKHFLETQVGAKDVFVGKVTVPISLIIGTASKKEKTGWFDLTTAEDIVDKFAASSSAGQVKLAYSYEADYGRLLTGGGEGDEGMLVWFL